MGYINSEQIHRDEVFEFETQLIIAGEKVDILGDCEYIICGEYREATHEEPEELPNATPVRVRIQAISIAESLGVSGLPLELDMKWLYDNLPAMLVDEAWDDMTERGLYY
jgi:hypothetical protein